MAALEALPDDQWNDLADVTALVARSGRVGGGRHIFFQHPGFKVRSSSGEMAPGLDAKGDGGYIILAPSWHVSGNQYAWERYTDDAPPLAPSWLVTWANTAKKTPPKSPQSGAKITPFPTAHTSGYPTNDQAESARYWVDRYLTVAQDGNRNDTGKDLALQLRDTDMSYAQAEPYMLQYQRGVPGNDYTEAEALATLRSVYSQPAREPAKSQVKMARERAASASRPRPASGTQAARPSSPTSHRTQAASSAASAVAEYIVEDDGWEDVPPNNTSDDGPQARHNGTGGTQDDETCAYTLTEFGNAERLLAAHGADMRFCSAFGFLTWDGTRWRAGDAEMTIREWAKDVIKALRAEAAELAREAARASDADADALTKMATDLLKWAMTSHRDKMVSAMLSLAKSAITVDSSLFDADPMLFNCANGTLDLRTGALHAHRREDYLMQRSPIRYTPQASAPRFLRFINEIACDREDLAGYLQRAFGYSLTGDVSDQVWHLLVGEGENGKSKLLDTIAYVMGDYAGVMDAASIMASTQQRDANAPSPEIAGLKGKRLVRISETPAGRISPEKIKKLSGGDMLQARHLNRGFFEFVPTFKLFVYTNEKPQTRETTHAFWRRVRYVPFDLDLKSHPDRKDPQLDGKLRAEAEGILAWLVAGCLTWQHGGLQPPQAVCEATEQYKQDMDVMQQMWEQVFTSDASSLNHHLSSRQAYAAYVGWCKANGEHELSEVKFSAALTDRFRAKKEHTRSGNVWLDLVIAPDWQA